MDYTGSVQGVSLPEGRETREKKMKVKMFERSEARQWERWLCHRGLDPSTLSPEEEEILREELRKERARFFAPAGHGQPGAEAAQLSL